jgi:hypothetical protein
MSDDNKEDSKVLPIAAKGINILAILVFAIFIITGFTSRGYSFQAPTPGRLAIMAIILVVLMSFGNLKAIFLNKKKDETVKTGWVSKLFNSIFLISIFAMPIIKGLGLDVIMYIFLPYTGVTLLTNWAEVRAARAVDIATDGGEKDLSIKEVGKALVQGSTENVNAFTDGSDILKKWIGILKDQRNALEKALTLTLPRPEAKRVPMVSGTAPIAPAGTTVIVNSEGTKTTGAEYDPTKYQNVGKLKAIVDSNILFEIDNRLIKIKQSEEDVKKNKTFGSDTIEIYRDMVESLSNIYLRSLNYCWEKYNVITAGKSYEGNDKNHEIWKRFTNQENVLKIILDIMSTYAHIFDGMEKQINILDITNNKIPQIDIVKIDQLDDPKPKKILAREKPKKPDKESFGDKTFSEIKNTKKTLKLIDEYIKNIKKVGTNKAGNKYNSKDDAKAVGWPDALVDDDGNCSNEKVIEYKG